MEKKWLITGGCGFIGTNLVSRLVASGKSVRILDNMSFGIPCRFPEVEFVEGDITDPDVCLKCCKDIGIVVHLAANTGVEPSVMNPRKDMEENIVGTFNMLEAAKVNHIKKFVFASSGAAVGECDPPIREDTAPNPVSPYGASKLAGEAYCRAYQLTFGVDTVALRFSNVYGPESVYKGSVVSKFIRQALDGKVFEIYGDGTQTRDFIYVDDLVNAIFRSSERGSGVYQIATNIETSIFDLIRKLLMVLSDVGYKNITICRTDPRVGDVRRNFAYIKKAHNELGWRPEVTLDDGLRMTVDWFLNG